MNWSIKYFEELRPEELYAMMQLRIAVFSIEQNCIYQDADGKDLKAWHIMAHDSNGELVAYARVLPQQVSYDEVSIGRVVTASSVRKTGIGKELMTRTMEFIKKQFGPVPVRISAQCYLVNFYEGFGFTTVGEEYEEDHLPHIEMLFP